MATLDRTETHPGRLGQFRLSLDSLGHHVLSGMLSTETNRSDHGPDNTFTPDRAVNLAATSAKSA